MRFPVGLSYVSGLNDVVDRYEDNLKAEGFQTDSAKAIPVGLAFRPYFQFENGLAVGADVGPSMWVIGDVDFFNIPVGVSARYYFIPDSDISPYVRAGLSYNIASGDYVESSELGFFGAAGVEFLRNKTVSMGFELAYDSSAIEFEALSRSGGTLVRDTETITPGGLTISLLVIF